MAIARQDSFLILSSDDRAGRRDGKHKPGGIYFVDLRDPSLEPKKISENVSLPLNPHGISLYKMDSINYRLWVVNHVRGMHSIEVFGLQRDSLWHEQTIQGDLLDSPNDVVAIDPDRFYVTNDHGYTSKWGKMAEDYLGLAVSYVLFYDGTTFKKAAENIAYANGINADIDRQLLYVASPRGFQINVYAMQPNGLIELIDEVEVGTGIDNLEIDDEGVIWSAGHPQLLKFSAYAAGKLPIAPTEVIKVEFFSPGKSKVTPLFIDDGSLVSAGSAAVPFASGVFVGNVMDKQYLFIHRIND